MGFCPLKKVHDNTKEGAVRNPQGSHNQHSAGHVWDFTTRDVFKQKHLCCGSPHHILLVVVTGDPEL